jgi:CRP/FNR family transcriptional regulator
MYDPVVRALPDITQIDPLDTLRTSDMTYHPAPASLAFYGAVTVGTRGQIVVPQRLREDLGVEAGEQLLVLRGPRPGSFLVQRAETLLAGLEGGQTAPQPLVTTSAAAPPGAAHGANGHAPAPHTTAARVSAPPDLQRELAALSAFNGLSPATLERLAALVRRRRFGPGAVILHEGEPCTAMYIVRGGLVRVLKTSPDGREQVLALLGPGDAFNEVPLFDGGPNPASAQALEASDLYELPREDLTALMTQDSSVALGLTRTLAARLRKLTGVIEDLSFRHVTGRIAHLLLEQADGRLPATHISQQAMAAMVGTAREVAGRALHSLEAARAIRLEQGRIVILDRAKLESYL